MTYQVVSVLPQDKKKVMICLDNGDSFVLYKGEAAKLSLFENEVVDDTKYQQIMTEILGKRATKRAMHLLEQQERTEKQLRDKLAQCGYPKQCIEQAIAYVKSYHYVDDYRYCKSYISCYGDKCSRQQILSRLLAKGVDKNCILEAYEEVQSMGEVASEEELIYALLSKKHFDIATADMKSRQKMYRHLLYKGFSVEGVSRVFHDSFQ